MKCTLLIFTKLLCTYCQSYESLNCVIHSHLRIGMRSKTCKDFCFTQNPHKSHSFAIAMSVCSIDCSSKRSPHRLKTAHWVENQSSVAPDSPARSVEACHITNCNHLNETFFIILRNATGALLHFTGPALKLNSLCGCLDKRFQGQAIQSFGP